MMRGTVQGRIARLRNHYIGATVQFGTQRYVVMSHEGNWYRIRDRAGFEVAIDEDELMRSTVVRWCGE